MEEREGASTRQLVVALVFAFLFFPLGALLGIGIFHGGDRRDGTVVIATACAVAGLSFLGASGIANQRFVLFAAVAMAAVLAVAMIVRHRVTGQAS